MLWKSHSICVVAGCVECRDISWFNPREAGPPTQLGVGVMTIEQHTLDPNPRPLATLIKGML